MTETEYRSHPAISRSSLFRLTESPEKFKYYLDNPPEPTPALIFGQLFHKTVLQPETLWDDFAVTPRVDRRTKAGREVHEAFAQQAEGKTVISAMDAFRAMQMSDAVRANALAAKLLSGAKEIPYFWTDGGTGEPCKCRVDCITEIGGKPVVVDLKSTVSAETGAFTREAVKYGYDMQAAMYSEGVKAATGEAPLFVFVAVEKEPPHAVNILQADKLLLRRGYDLFRELIGVYHDCRATGNWYGYLGKFNVINRLCLPAWLAREVE